MLWRFYSQRPRPPKRYGYHRGFAGAIIMARLTSADALPTGGTSFRSRPLLILNRADQFAFEAWFHPQASLKWSLEAFVHTFRSPNCAPLEPFYQICIHRRVRPSWQIALCPGSALFRYWHCLQPWFNRRCGNGNVCLRIHSRDAL